MLRKTSFAISTDESRYVLNGIFFSLKEHKLTMVATDGRRLALVDEEVDVSEKSQGEFIVPAKAVTELNEGNYPNYRQVIPSEAKERVTVAREEFMHALRRAEIMTSDKSNSVKL